MLPSLEEIQAAAQIVYQQMPPTPQYRWPLLCQELGTEIWVKHENHTPVGAFKIRGGLVYFDALVKSGNLPAGVISATRGNHGQSIGFAAQRYGIPATIVVPHGNSQEKNAAMRAFGVSLIEHGEDFQEAREYAQQLAEEQSLLMIPSFHPQLIEGVATYSLELFQAVNAIDVIYVPIGLGSGICGMIAARNTLGLSTRIVGVVSAHATAYADSFKQKQLIESPVSTKIADGMACRTPEPDAMKIIWQHVDHIVQVTDDEVASAMSLLFEYTHNASEGAGAAALAAALQEKDTIRSQKTAIVISGGNIDRELFASILQQGCA